MINVSFCYYYKNKKRNKKEKENKKTVIKIFIYKSMSIVLEGDYADCLSLLMRGTQISKPVTLVEQAKYLQGNLSHDGALQILQQNDIRLGKEPRDSLWKNEDKSSLENYYQQQQNDLSFSHHQRTSNQNFNGLSNLTRGVMKSPQVRDLNKAIAGVMGTVQVTYIFTYHYQNKNNKLK